MFDIKSHSIKNFVILISFFIVWSFCPAVSAATLCESFFSKSEVHSTRGRNLSPIEWLTNIKLKIKTSETLKNFNEQKYQQALAHIRQENLSGKNNFIPTSLEEYIAYLDSSLTELNLSIIKMDPVIRHKIYKTVNKILLSSNRRASDSSARISRLVFKGSFEKTTSFHYLLTHLFKEVPDVAAEMFSQHLYELVITQIVRESFKSNSELASSNKTIRVIPQWIKDRSEFINLAIFTAFDIANSIATGTIVPVLTPFNIHKLKSKKFIEESLSRNGLKEALTQLGPKFSNKNQFNYYYAVAVKSLNWYFIGYVLAPFFF